MKKISYLIDVLSYAMVLYAAEVFLPHLTWHIPFGNINIPIAFWSILLVYSFIFIKRSKTLFKSPLSVTAATGIGLNLIYAFIQNEIYRRSSAYIFEASIYKYYYYVIYYFGVPLISFLAGYV